MRYLVLCLLFIVGCKEKGKTYERVKEVCVEGHSYTYMCYNATLKMMSTCHGYRCDRYKCYHQRYRYNGFFSANTILKEEEVSCK